MARNEQFKVKGKVDRVPEAMTHQGVPGGSGGGKKGPAARLASLMANQRRACPRTFITSSYYTRA